MNDPLDKEMVNPAYYQGYNDGLNDADEILYNQRRLVTAVTTTIIIALIAVIFYLITLIP